MSSNIYNIWRVQKFYDSGLSDIKYTLINSKSYSYNDAENIAFEYKKCIQKLVNKNGKNKIIANYYDRLYIINVNDSIKYYYGKEYYDFIKMDYDCCFNIINNKINSFILYGTISILYLYILFLPIDLNEEEKMNYYQIVMTDGMY